MTRHGAQDEGLAIGVPLLLEPTLDLKPWGGRRLARYGKTLPPEPIGESIESGSDSVIVGGPFDGVTLGTLAQRHPAALLGTRGVLAAGDFADFPLLVKLIDAQQDLSIQVHPSDGQAPPGKRGKTEAWLVLEAEDGGSLITGVTGAIDPDTIGCQVVREPVDAGDVFFVPAGTVHAIGAGVLLYEVQQASDVTYRLYDWGRPRELHLVEGLAAADPTSRARRVSPVRRSDAREILVACSHFALERWRIEGTSAVRSDAGTCRVITVIDGTVTIASVRAERGRTVVLPADFRATDISGDATILIASVPDLDTDVIGPARGAGYDDAAIRQLGVDAR